jgi:methionyl-tRNA formyltransferase
MSTQSESVRPRVVLVGLGPTTESALEGLYGPTDVVALIRDGDDTASARARELQVPLVTDASLDAVRDAVQAVRPDCVVVSSYHRILPADLVESCPFINVHYAPLPRLRGRATVNWAIINGHDSAWISIHWLVAGLDAGGLLFQGSVPISARSTVATAYDALNELQRKHIAAAVRAAINGDPGRSQDETAATYACTRIESDGEIDWHQSTRQIDRLVRALVGPYPGAFTWLGLERLHIDQAMPVADPPTYEGRIPGRVVAVRAAGGTVDVLTGDGVLRLQQVRLGDGAPVRAADVVRSVRATLGLRTSDLVPLLTELLSRRDASSR